MIAPTVSVSDEQEAVVEHPEIAEEFRVKDESSANWVVRKITACDDEEKRIEEFAMKELARVRHDRESLLFRFSRSLQDWAAAEVEKLKGKRKKIRLPSGSLSFRREGAKLVFDDEAAVTDWARKHCPKAIQTAERLSRSIVKEHFEATGEMPSSGVHIEPEREVFRIS